MTKPINRIKTLVADDSVFMRKLIIDILHSDSGIEVVGEAKNGIEAVEKAIDLKPMVVIMDHNMPKMNGAQAISRIMAIVKDNPPSVIVLTAYSKKEIVETLDSLRVGAVDFIAKPSGELSLDIDVVKEEIIRKVKAAAKAHIHKTKKIKRVDEHEARKEKAVNVIAIGSSTGGPPIIENILAGLPSDLSAAILVVQHMPANFTSNFSELVNTNTSFLVKQAEEGEVIRTGTCYIAPGGMHMQVEIREEKDHNDYLIHLTKEPKVNGYRPSIDVLMKSIAVRYAGRALGIILTGMGYDGLEGMREINFFGGYTIVQSPESSVVASMPNSVIDKGLANEILDPENITKRIIELTKKYG